MVRVDILDIEITKAFTSGYIFPFNLDHNHCSNVYRRTHTPCTAARFPLSAKLYKISWKLYKIHSWFSLITKGCIIQSLRKQPQLVLNARRRSTSGWSIENILLDFLGGTLSIVQLFLDSFAFQRHPWAGVKGNLAKLGLGLIAITFDIAFILQHYVFYGPVEPQSQAVDEESRPLLSD